MNLQPLRVTCCVIIFHAVILPGWGQQRKAYSAPRSTVCSSMLHPEAAIDGRYRLARTIKDFSTQQRWLLLEDSSHPAAPALLMEEARTAGCAGRWTQSTVSRASIPSFVPIVIHAGDPIIVSEHTRVADAELEATALRTAAVGDPLLVRMKFGDLTLKAIAVSPGHAKVAEKAGEESQ